jgi:hypothetical protein
MLFLDKVDDLTKTNQLTTGFVNMAMSFLKQHHPNIGGLFCSPLGASLNYPKAQGDKWLQIVHDGSNHWVLVAKGFSQPEHVLVYDSMPRTPWDNAHVLSCMSSLLKTPKKEMSYLVKNCQRQSNGFDCGVFAIAFATSLANGEDPATRLYDPKQLRTHLSECMTTGEMTLFPSYVSRRTRCRETVEKVEVDDYSGYADDEWWCSLP